MPNVPQGKNTRNAGVAEELVLGHQAAVTLELEHLRLLNSTHFLKVVITNILT